MANDVISNETSRYTLRLPTELYEELRAVADKEGATVVELLRKSVKLLLLGIELQKNQGGLAIKKDNIYTDFLIL